VVEKRVCTADQAVSDISDGAVVMIGGFAAPGVPEELVKALLRQAPHKLTTISNGAHGRRSEVWDAAKLVEAGLVARCISSFPVAGGASAHNAVEAQYLQGQLEVVVIPQGTLSEQIRAGGAGIPAFWVPTGVGTAFEEGKEKRLFKGKVHLLEHALTADFALIKASRADTLGNLVYDKVQRNFGPTMATAGRITIAEVGEIVQPGEIPSESIITPGIYIDRLVIAEGRGANSK
jgi:3-oxoacid CoA-transferase A subunit